MNTLGEIKQYKHRWWKDIPSWWQFQFSNKTCVCGKRMTFRGWECLGVCDTCIDEAYNLFKDQK